MRLRRVGSRILPFVGCVFSMAVGGQSARAQVPQSQVALPQVPQSQVTLPQVKRQDVNRDAGVRACPREDRVQLNLTAWKASLKRAETTRRRDELLREMGLSLDEIDGSDSSEGSEVVSPAEQSQVTLLGIDDSPVRLEPGRFPDHVIDVRFQIQRPSGKTVAHLVQVLRLLGAPDWCRLGIDLSRREGEEEKLEAYALGFVPLLNANSRAIEVHMVDSRLRHNETTRQYWVTSGFKLAKVFDQKIASMENLDGGRETTAKIGKLALIGEFPKRIELKQETKHVVCVTPAEDVPCSESDGSTVATFVYNGKIYVQRK